MRWLGILPLALLVVSSPSLAEASADPLGWLNRITSAAQRLNYSGTFVYQSGTNYETSRIVHMVDGKVEREKLEVLDGSPREIVRTNDEVQCFLPAQRRVIVEQQVSRSVFPSLRPDSVGGLAQFYRIQIGGRDRVAGQDAQMLSLEPRDQFRYGHQLWAHVGSGLLLKSRMIDGRGETVEQFSFTQVEIGGNFDRAALRSRFGDLGEGWQVVRSEPADMGADAGMWVFRNVVPGFQRSVAAKRQLKSGSQDTMHFVFSDGMAAISVFIEPLGDRSSSRAQGHFRNGATNGYQRVLSGHLITAVGEVPPKALQTIVDGVEARQN